MQCITQCNVGLGFCPSGIIACVIALAQQNGHIFRGISKNILSRFVPRSAIEKQLANASNIIWVVCKFVTKFIFRL